MNHFADIFSCVPFSAWVLILVFIALMVALLCWVHVHFVVPLKQWAEDEHSQL